MKEEKATIKLYCIPYAGGSALIYSKWKKYANNEIEIITLELAGRGKRMNEPLYNNIYEAVDDLFDIIKEKLDEPYSFYGHSMGCLIIYELCKKIRAHNLCEPLHIFLSGRKSPNYPILRIGDYPDDRFISKLIELGGVTQEFIESKELREIFLPIIRSDFKMCEAYVYESGFKFNCNITIFYGEDDDLTKDGIEEWSEFTKKECEYIEFPGSHFFINTYTQEIMEIINEI